MALEVGRVFASLGFRVDDDGINRWERRLHSARREARDDVDAHLGAKVDDRGFRRYNDELDRSERHTSRFGKAAGAGFGVAKAGLVGVAGAAGATTLALGFFAKANAEAESSEARMRAQLKASGESWRAHRKEIDQTIQKQSELKAFDDEDLQDSFTNIFRVVGDVTKSLELNNLAMDLARAKHLDVAKAGELVGKVAGGNTGILARYGIVIEKGATAQEALAELQQKFAGQADEYGKTSGAAFDRVQVAGENLAESAGKVMAPLVTEGANAIADLISQANTDEGFGGGLKDGLKGVGSVVGWFVDRAKDLIDVVTSNQDRLDGLADTARSLWRSLKTAFAGVRDAFTSTFGKSSGTGRDIRSIIDALLDLQAWVFKVVAAITKRALPGIITAFRGLAQIIRGVVRVIAGILTLDFGKAWDGVKDIFSGGVKAIAGLLRSGTAGIREAAAGIARGIGNALSSGWDAAVDTARSFVNRVIDVVNKLPFVDIGHVGGGGTGTAGIARKAAAGAAAGAFAEGGKVTMPVAIMGEEAPEHPEWVIPTNPAYRGRALGLWAMAARELGIPGFATGGIVGGALNLGKRVVKGAAGLAGSIVGDLPSNPGGPLTGLFDYVIDKAKSWIKDKASSALSSVGIGGGGGGRPAGSAQLRAWLTEALQITGNYSPANLNALIGRAMQESGGNPRAQNNWDSNARAGHPSKGLLQTIPSTFAAHMLPGRGNIWDPVDNAVAAIRYMLATYGHIVGPSSTGYARGGILARIGGQLLAGGTLGYKTGGRTKARKKTAAKPTLTTADNRGIKRSVARGTAGIAGYEQDIQDLEREYDQQDRRYGLSDEVVLVEHDDGSVTIDEDAVNQRLTELDALLRKRDQIKRKIEAYRRAIGRLIRTLQAAVKKLDNALKAAKGKSRAKERAGYRAAIDEYQTRIGELRGTHKNLAYDVEDQRIDITELLNERDAVKSTVGHPAPVDAADASPDAAASSDASPGPSAQDIAIAASEQFQAFNAAREQLFRDHGSNNQPVGTDPYATTTQQAAGAQFFGAAGGTPRAYAAPGGRVTFIENAEFNNVYPATPPDGGTHVQQQAREVAVAFA